MPRLEQCRSETLCVSYLFHASHTLSVLTCHLSKTYPDGNQQEEVRQGFNPDKPQAAETEQMHNTDQPFTVGEESESEAESRDELGEEQPWQKKDYGAASSSSKKPRAPQYGSFREERHVWGDDEY